ncbi:hypothetical protein KR084_006306 [Drosophila pseudotakahashii]|nr:hypothetical protein KR084_006306 [Drosophila pseudotakahashii]
MNCKWNYCSPLNKNTVVERSLELRFRGAQARNYLKICCVHVVILLFFLRDIWQEGFRRQCWCVVAEYSITAVLGLSALACIIKCLWMMSGDEQVIGTESQKCLLDGKDENLFGTVYTRPLLKTGTNLPETDWKPLNWHSSYNAYWRPKKTLFGRGNLQMCKSPYEELNPDDFITDIRKLPALMKRARRERKAIEDINNDFLRKYSNYPTCKINNTYQYIPLPQENGRQVRNLENIPKSKFLQYVSNLRFWISTTILHRLVNEIEYVNKVFQEIGFYNIRIGAISLERLRSIVADQGFVRTHVPMLPTVLAFLDTFSNQEYLVLRIQELAEGNYMSTFRPSSSGYEMDYCLDWLDVLPTDASIIFHLFCVYMDIQLLPLPQVGGERPFYSRYVITRDYKSKENVVSRVKNKAKCAILVTSNAEREPNFNFISDNQLHDCVYNRNNLFHVIIQFFTYMRDKRGSELESVNLGQSGINIMGVIENTADSPAL